MPNDFGFGPTTMTMQIQVQAIQFKADDKLVQFIQDKLKKLELFFDRIINAEVYLSLEGASTSGRDKIVKIKLNLPGGQIIATESSRVFEESADKAVESLRRQIRRYKDKIRGN